MTVDLSSVMILLALQLLVLGWRLVREIGGAEPQPSRWVPIPDNVNVLAMLAVLYFCLVAPLTATGLRLYSVGVLARATFASASVLIVFHPLVVASHYRLWSGGRGSDDPENEVAPYCTRQEAIVQLVALAAAAVVVVWVLQAAQAPLIELPRN